MSDIIPLPDNNFRTIEWRLVQPTQVNRSEFTSARQVLRLPGAAYWRASAEHVPIKGEANVRIWRSFMSKLRGQVNVFPLPAGEGAQSPERIGITGVDIFGANTANITLSTNRTLSKTAGGTAWNSSWRFAAQGTNDLAVSARIANLTPFFFGLVASPAITDPPTMDYGWSINLNGDLNVSVLGTPILALPASVGGHLLIERQGTAVRFYYNGLMVYTATVASNYAPAVDFNGYALGPFVSDVHVFTPATASGINSINIRGLNSLAPEVAREGSFATLILRNRTAQLVTITNTSGADVDGVAPIRFEPIARGAPLAVILDRPWCVVAMDSAETAHAVAPGALYGFSLNATEAF